MWNREVTESLYVIAKGCEIGFATHGWQAAGVAFTYPGFFGCEATIVDLLEGDPAFSTDSSSKADGGGGTSP